MDDDAPVLRDGRPLTEPCTARAVPIGPSQPRMRSHRTLERRWRSPVELTSAIKEPARRLPTLDRVADPAPTSDGAEQRATARVTFVRPAVIEVDAEPAPQRYDAQIVDISPAGVGMVAVEPLLVGMTVAVVCTLPGRRQELTVNLRATIRWRQQLFADDMVLGRDCFQYGLQFVDVTPRQESALLGAVFFIETTKRVTAESDAGRKDEVRKPPSA